MSFFSKKIYYTALIVLFSIALDDMTLLRTPSMNIYFVRIFLQDPGKYAETLDKTW